MKIVEYYGVYLQFPEWVEWIAIDKDGEIVGASTKMYSEMSYDGNICWANDDEHGGDDGEYFKFINDYSPPKYIYILQTKNQKNLK